MANAEKKCFLWSEKRQLWWKPEAHGYTSNLVEAGRYTEEEAARYLPSGENENGRKVYVLRASPPAAPCTTRIGLIDTGES